MILETAESLARLGAPLLCETDVSGNVECVTEVLLQPGQDRARLVAWCLGERDGQEVLTERDKVELLTATGTCTSPGLAHSFITGQMGRKDQLQVTALSH